MADGARDPGRTKRPPACVLPCYAIPAITPATLRRRGDRRRAPLLPLRFVRSGDGRYRAQSTTNRSPGSLRTEAIPRFEGRSPYDGACRAGTPAPHSARRRTCPQYRAGGTAWRQRPFHEPIERTGGGLPARCRLHRLLPCRRRATWCRRLDDVVRPQRADGETESAVRWRVLHRKSAYGNTRESRRAPPVRAEASSAPTRTATPPLRERRLRLEALRLRSLRRCSGSPEPSRGAQGRHAPPLRDGRRGEGSGRQAPPLADRRPLLAACGLGKVSPDGAGGEDGGRSTRAWAARAVAGACQRCGRGQGGRRIAARVRSKPSAAGEPGRAPPPAGRAIHASGR